MMEEPIHDENTAEKATELMEKAEKEHSLEDCLEAILYRYTYT